MRRATAAFLITGSILVVALEARTTLACLKEGLDGPYPERPSEAEDAIALESRASPALAAAEVPAVLLPSILLVGF